MLYNKSAGHRGVPASSARKAYVAPDVVEYGSLRDITLALGATGKNDGAQSQPQKTSLP